MQLLINDFIVLFDEADYEIITKYFWYVSTSNGGSYAATKIEGKQVYMHRLLTGATSFTVKIDHRNNNTLDNRRENLRVCTDSQNKQNSLLRKDNKSGFKGVRFMQRKPPLSRPWNATINTSYGQKSLGCFATAEEAHAAYCEAAKKYFGEFANSGV